LACILLQHGHVAHELEKQLTRPGLCTAEEAAALIARARALASRTSMSGRTDMTGHPNRADDQPGDYADGRAGDRSGDHADQSGEQSGDDHANDQSGEQSGDDHANGQPGDDDANDQSGEQFGDHAYEQSGDHSDEYEILQRDPAANPALMRRLEVLTDLALLAVCDDSVLVGSEVYPRGRQSLNLDGDFRRISFWAPDAVIEDLNRYLDNLRERTGPLPVWASLMILVRDAVDVWKQVDRKKKKPQFWRVFERDDYRCQIPTCSKRADMHGHHVVFRSHGGSDDPSNVVSACYGHHKQGVHEGHIRCTGNANHGLRWVLGPRAKHGGPFRIYQGDLRIG
jgi:hypothetical protein